MANSGGVVPARQQSSPRRDVRECSECHKAHEQQMAATDRDNWVFLDCWEQVARSYERHEPIKSHFLCSSKYQTAKAPCDEAPAVNSEDSMPAGSQSGLPAITKKRKRKKPPRTQIQPNPAEARASERHAAVHGCILASWQAFMSEKHRSPQADAVTTEEPPSTKLLANCVLRRCKICNAEKELDYLAMESNKHVLYPKIRIGIGGKKSDVFDRIVHAPCAQEEVEASVMKTSILLPSGSVFLMSDISRVQLLVDESARISGFDMMILDPPWENASARRSRAYGTLPNYSLFSLPVRQLLASKGSSLVGLWVTNREKLRKFVEEELLQHWGLRQVATWYWLKTTSDGAMVTSLESEHRRPYEPLVIARLASADNHASMNPHANDVLEPPDNLTIISEPGCHSRKPRVGHLLKKYVSEQPRCVELFARELEKDWTSWGNEVLKFQDTSMFRPKDKVQLEEQTATQPE